MLAYLSLQTEQEESGPRATELDLQQIQIIPPQKTRGVVDSKATVHVRKQ